MAVWLPRELLCRLRAVAAGTGITQADLVKTALEPYLRRIVKQRGIEKLVEELMKQRSASGKTAGPDRPA